MSKTGYKEFYMKNVVKWIGIIILGAVIGFSMVGCYIGSNNDYELLNGDWDSGGYIVTFNDGRGVFKDLYADYWLNAKNDGKIKIGDQCYRNFVKSDDRKWKCEIRVYNTYNASETLRWEKITITLSSDGQTLNMGGWNLTRIQQSAVDKKTYTFYSQAGLIPRCLRLSFSF